MRILVLLISTLFIGEAVAQPDSLSKDNSWAVNRQRIFVKYWDNPALTGGEGRNNIDVQYSSRLETKYSYFLAFSNRLGEKEKWALGYTIRRIANGSFGNNIFPWAGILTETTLNITSSYKFEFGDHILRPGFSVGYMSKKLNWEDLTFGDMIDPRYGFVYDTQETQVNDTRGVLDFDMGVEYLFRGYYLEAAIRHATQPPQGFVNTGDANLPMEVVIHSGYRLRTGNKLHISPYLISRKSIFYTVFTPGVLGEIGEKALLGFSYDNLNTITLNTGYHIQYRLRVLVSAGFSTDEILADLSPVGYWKGAITYFFNHNKGG